MLSPSDPYLFSIIMVGQNAKKSFLLALIFQRKENQAVR